MGGGTKPIEPIGGLNGYVHAKCAYSRRKMGTTGQP
jgi:hypothetical protein